MADILKRIFSNCVTIMGKQTMDNEDMISRFVFCVLEMLSNRLIPAYSVRIKMKLANMNNWLMNKLPNATPKLWKRMNIAAL